MNIYPTNLDFESLEKEHVFDAIYRLLRFQYSKAKESYTHTFRKAEHLINRNKMAQDEYMKDEDVGFGYSFQPPHTEREIQAARDQEANSKNNYEESKAALDNFVRYFIKNGV